MAKVKFLWLIQLLNTYKKAKRVFTSFKELKLEERKSGKGNLKQNETILIAVYVSTRS